MRGLGMQAVVRPTTEAAEIVVAGICVEDMGAREGVASA